MDQETLTNESVIASNPRSALQHLRQPARLPAEILVQIFLLSLPPLYAAQAPQKTALALVCRLWHAIVDSTPTLWSQISIADSLTYIRTSLLKSGEHPIDLYGQSNMLHIPPSPPASCGGACCEFLPAVASHAERWRHVLLEVWTFQVFNLPITPFPSLRSFELHSKCRWPIDRRFRPLFNGASTPHLRKMRLQYLQIDHWDLFSLPLSLSTLEIEGIDGVCPSVNRLLSILATCPNLTAFRLYRIYPSAWEIDRDMDGGATVPAVVKLTALQELDLRDIPTDYMRRLLQQLSISDECIVSVMHEVFPTSSPSTSFLTPVLEHHRRRFQPAKVTIDFIPCAFNLVVAGERWRVKLHLNKGDRIRDPLEWFGISTANSSNASSGSEPLQAGSTTLNSTPVTLELGKAFESSFFFDIERLPEIADFQCIRRIKIDRLSAHERAALFWYLSGPEDPDQPSRVRAYPTFDNPGPKKQITGIWPFPGVCELVVKGTDAQLMRALLNVIKCRSGGGATAEASGMPARLERIEFVDGDSPDRPGEPYDPHEAERVILDILNVLDDDAELFWRGNRISKA